MKCGVESYGALVSLTVETRIQFTTLKKVQQKNPLMWYVILAPRGHLSMTKYIFGCHDGVWGATDI